MWSCVSCLTKVDETFDVCWNCGTSREGVPDPTFVRADDEGPIADAPSQPGAAISDGPGGEVVEVYRALDLMEASFLAGQLTDAGYPATADQQDMHETLGSMTSTPRVYVNREHYTEARAWLADYDRNKSIEAGRDDDAPVL